MAFEDGPFVQAACFCEMVLQEGSGVASLIRVVDTINHRAHGPEPPEEMQPFLYKLTLVVMLKSGSARGRHELKIVPEKPDGSTLDPVIHSFHFEGEEKGHNVFLNMNMTFEYEGLYWFDIFLGDEKLTAIPLRVKYLRVVA